MGLPIEGVNSNITSPTPAANSKEAALQQAAKQFEAVLLNQLTSSLNSVSDDSEDGLFGNEGGGMSASRQMFSEQMAKTMSESGGIGLADLIMSQLTKKLGAVDKNSITSKALSLARDIKEGRLQPTANVASNASLPSELTSGVENSDLSSTPVVSSAAQPSSNSIAPASATRPRRVHPGKLSAVTASDSPTTVSKPGSTDGPKHFFGRVTLQAPIHGEIRSVFGMRRDPINGRMRLHKGIDIAAKSGTPIGAAAGGTVVFAGKNHGYGNMVLIEHADGRQTLYAHAERLFVRAGDTVKTGQTIAAVGSTGHSTGPHLHFEVRESSRAVNPLEALANDLALSRR